jgi:hypothetical protein
VPRNVQIKNVPDDVHRIHRRRAGAAGQSLQEYLLGELVRSAHRPTVPEVLARAGERRGGRLGLASAAADVRAERDSRP